MSLPICVTGQTAVLNFVDAEVKKVSDYVIVPPSARHPELDGACSFLGCTHSAALAVHLGLTGSDSNVVQSVEVAPFPDNN